MPFRWDLTVVSCPDPKVLYGRVTWVTTGTLAKFLPKGLILSTSLNWLLVSHPQYFLSTKSIQQFHLISIDPSIWFWYWTTYSFQSVILSSSIYRCWVYSGHLSLIEFSPPMTFIFRELLQFSRQRCKLIYFWFLLFSVPIISLALLLRHSAPVPG